MTTPDSSALLRAIATVHPDNFEAIALDVFRYQAKHNPLYARYLELLRVNMPSAVRRLPPAVPFLPISFFKTHNVKSGDWVGEVTYTSSATTGQTPSRHAVRHTDFYLENARRGFAQHYGDPSEWCVLALLPAYLERQGSSLVAMADDFIRRSKHSDSGFFLHDFERLRSILLRCKQQNIKTLLLGVSFALLDFAEQYPMDLRGVTVMETGGMKGRRREITRSELHQILCGAFQLEAVHSEYGMTELLSQAYALGGPLFSPAPTMRVLAREINDPFCPVLHGRTGLLHIVDLANVDTCSFIATEDLGRVYPDGRFEVLGRLDAAEMRGCNLMTVGDGRQTMDGAVLSSAVSRPPFSTAATYPSPPPAQRWVWQRWASLGA